VNESERRVAEALEEAWSRPGAGADAHGALDAATAASVVAASWLAVVRVLLVGRRAVLCDTAGAARSAAGIQTLMSDLLGTLEQCMDRMPGWPVEPDADLTGWPADVRRAG
jgi:hypothetical protein